MVITSILWRDRPIEIEYQWVNNHDKDIPVMVFLHEGLGSIALWRDFPKQLCETLNLQGLVYSRPGYGWSTERKPDEHWNSDFMHQQALEVLPNFLESLGISQPVWLLGHSDGGSISLLTAAHQPKLVNGVIVMAPHILVEDMTISSIQMAREEYQNKDLRQKLMKYHQNVDSAFWGWNTIWLNPQFKSWNIETELRKIQCPVMAIQGFNDPYGTMYQIEGIKKQLPTTHLIKIEDCGHSPHREQPIIVIQSIRQFLLQQAVIF